MNSVALAAAAGLVLAASSPADSHIQFPMSRTNVTCFKTGEQTSGLNKICYYNCVGPEAAITVGAAQLCPLTINR